MDRILQIRLEHAVQLQPLPRRDAKCGVADLVAQIELVEQLPAGELAAGDFGPDHEDEGLLLLPVLHYRPASHVPVVLLVGAVELQQHFTRFAEVIVRIHHLWANIPSQKTALVLDGFNRAGLTGFGHGESGNWATKTLSTMNLYYVDVQSKD